MLLLTIAIRNLTRRRTRTILTILGVAMAIAFTVAIILITHDSQVAQAASRTLQMIDGRLE
jgi:predicted ABC-type transport system involved in lysophospholipase L1 biosynthesis ATPase subunit